MLGVIASHGAWRSHQWRAGGTIVARLWRKWRVNRPQQAGIINKLRGAVSAYMALGNRRLRGEER